MRRLYAAMTITVIAQTDMICDHWDDESSYPALEFPASWESEPQCLDAWKTANPARDRAFVSNDEGNTTNGDDGRLLGATPRNLDLADCSMEEMTFYNVEVKMFHMGVGQGAGEGLGEGDGDSCYFANDGDCQEGSICEDGKDCTDCGTCAAGRKLKTIAQEDSEENSEKEGGSEEEEPLTFNLWTSGFDIQSVDLVQG